MSENNEYAATAGTVIPTAQPDKHLHLHNAIQETSSITEALDRLITRIEGPKIVQPAPAPAPPDCDKEERGNDYIPTLVELLNCSSNELRTVTSNILVKIDRLNALLFSE